MILEKQENEPKNIIFIYTTCSSTEEAREIGLSAVNARLAISADYWFVNSIYPWKGVVQEADQCMLMLSTQKSRSAELIKHIEVSHSYEIPVIVGLNSAVTNQLYSFWVENTLNSKDQYMTETEAKIKNEEDGYHYSRLK